MPYNIFYMRPSSFVSYYRARTHHYCLFMNDAIIYHALQITSILLRFFFFIFIHSFFFQYCIEVGTEYYVHAYCVLCNKYKTKRRKKKRKFIRFWENSSWDIDDDSVRVDMLRREQEARLGSQFIFHTVLYYTTKASAYFIGLGYLVKCGHRERERDKYFLHIPVRFLVVHIFVSFEWCAWVDALHLYLVEMPECQNSQLKTKNQKKKLDVLVRGRYGALQ